MNFMQEEDALNFGLTCQRMCDLLEVSSKRYVVIMPKRNTLLKEILKWRETKILIKDMKILFNKAEYNESNNDLVSHKSKEMLVIKCTPVQYVPNVYLH